MGGLICIGIMLGCSKESDDIAKEDVASPGRGVRVFKPSYVEPDSVTPKKKGLQGR
jgi:hypothetical protein